MQQKKKNFEQKYKKHSKFIIIWCHNRVFHTKAFLAEFGRIYQILPDLASQNKCREI